MRRLFALIIVLALSIVGGAVTAQPAAAVGTGSISGHVYGAGTPNVAMASTVVVAYSYAGAFGGSTYTDDLGAYSITGLNAGSYRIFFSSGFGLPWVGEWYLDSATEAGATLTPVGEGEAVTRDAVLARGGNLHGTITGDDAPGVGLASAEVWITTPGGIPVTSAAANASGQYVTTGLAPGSYVLEFRPAQSDEIHSEEWWNGASSAATATPVTVAAGDNLTLSPALPVGATIAGRVYTSDAETTGMAGAGIDIVDVATGLVVDGAGAAGDGTYSVTGLPAGTYAVHMLPISGSYASMWFDQAASRASSELVTLALGQSRTDVDMHGIAPISMFGNVLDEDGGVVAGSVVVYEAGYGAANSSTLVGRATLQSNGSYQVYSIAPGSSLTAVFTTDPLGYSFTTGVPITATNYLTLFNGSAPNYASAPALNGDADISLFGTFYQPLFADVGDPRSAFWSSIRWMSTEGISTGTAQPGGLPLYKPTEAVSRQAMASFLYKLSGETFTPPASPSFADVASGSTFYLPIEWMASKGISLGTAQPSGLPLYKPTDPVSRQAMAIFLSRYAGVTVTTPTSQSFADVPINSAPAGAIEWMLTSGISTGTVQPGGLPLYKPSDPVSRQAMALFLYRLAGTA